jgi:hypothetical protein
MKNVGLFRIDERVFITMAFFTLISILLLAYSYKNEKPCGTFKIAISSLDNYTGTVIAFKAQMKNGKQYEWDFDDKVKYVSSNYMATHVYNVPGNYTIYVTVDGKCQGYTNVIIKERPFMPMVALRPKFICPKTVPVNKIVTFTDTTEGATSWEWFFDDNGIVNNTNRKATWIFNTPGLKTVYLRINGRPEMQSMNRILVTEHNPIISNPKQLKPKPEFTESSPRVIKKYPDPLIQMDSSQQQVIVEHKLPPEIQADEMELLLEEVVTGKKVATDFSRYLCHNLDLAVKYNNEVITFIEMCYRLKRIGSLKRIKRPIVILIRDKLSGCLKSIDVTITKETFFKRIL